MASPLSDLDELVLKCRDEKAKEYIKEAISCYKTGAFRSSIVSTWIAVSFDIIEKIKELSLAGDAEANKQHEKIEKARADRDIPAYLKLEKELLILARDKFEFISHVEFIDLDRLQEDRHRCAHPSMTADGDIFNPPAELARVHIRSAVENLLQHPPAQGKYALERLITEIDSEYFPYLHKKAYIALNKSPLLKARKSLVRNLIIVLLKELLNSEVALKKERQKTSALKAIELMHKTVYDDTLDKIFSKLIMAIKDENLNNSFFFLKQFPESWDFLDRSVQQKLEDYVEALPKDKLFELSSLLTHPGLSAHAEKRVGRLTHSDLKDIYPVGIPSQYIDRMIELYIDSNSFSEANSFASTVIQQSVNFNKDQIKKIIIASGDNSQIKESLKIGNVISALRKNESVNDHEIDTWLKEAELIEYVKSSD
jgi:hypothetical protein